MNKKLCLDKQQEKSESIDVANQENPHKVSIEEQSDSDIVEDEERRDEAHERSLEYYFEKQEEIKKHNKTEQSERSIRKNENFLIQEKHTTPVTVSYEERKNPDTPVYAGAQDIVFDVHAEGEQSVEDASLKSASVLTTTKIFRHAPAAKVKISTRPPKKRPSSLINEVTTKMESNVTSAVDESSQKKVSYEQKIKIDPTSTEIEKAITSQFKMKLASTCKGLSEEEGYCQTSNFTNFYYWLSNVS